MEPTPNEARKGFTRRRLLVVAGGSAAAAGLVTLPGCGGDDEATTGQLALENANVDAPQLRSEPYIPSQLPLNCTVLSFFTAAEARGVDAFTARLIPGSTDDPGAREACVTNYIDRKLAEHKSFATTTYFHPPFAKPAKDRQPGFTGDTVYVDADELDRYGFQSSLTPQQAYRLGLKELDAYSRMLHHLPFEELSPGQHTHVPLPHPRCCKPFLPHTQSGRATPTSRYLEKHRCNLIADTIVPFTCVYGSTYLLVGLGLACDACC